MLNCIAVGATPGLLLAVQGMCNALSEICLLKTLDQFPTTQETSRLLNVLDPEVVLLEIHPSERCLEMAAELRRLRPEVVVIGFSRQLERARRAQAAGAGVAQVVVAPFTLDDLLCALVEAYQTRAPEVYDNLAALLPAKPGSGASLAALNVAAALAHLGRKVLVVDADRQNGVLSVTTQVEPVHTLDEALETSHELNDGVWEYRRISVHGFDLLPMPRRPSPRSFAPWTYRRLARFVRSRYDLVLADLAGVPSDTSNALLQQARTIWVMAAPDSPTLFLAQRRKEELANLGLTDERVSLIMNRSTDAADRLLGDGVTAVLPDDPEAARGAVETAGLVAPESRLGAAYRALARRLAGLPEEAEAASDQTGGLFSMFRRRFSARPS